MLEEKDESLNSIKKTRSSFLWNKKFKYIFFKKIKLRYFLIDEYKLNNGAKFTVLLIFVEEEEN